MMISSDYARSPDLCLTSCPEGESLPKKMCLPIDYLPNSYPLKPALRLAVIIDSIHADKFLIQLKAGSAIILPFLSSVHPETPVLIFVRLAQALTL
jgi:hypothetical protein